MTNFSEVKSPGGVHKTIRELGKWLSQRGHEVMVLQGNRLNLSREEVYDGYKIIRVNSRIGNFLYGLAPEISVYLKKHYKDINPDIVHVHGYHTLFSPMIIQTIREIDDKIPIIFSPHYMPLGHNTVLADLLWPVYNKITNILVFPKIDHVIVASKFEKESLISDIPYARYVDIEIIPHGVDVIDTKKKQKKGNDIILLFSGYLQKRKGIHYIIKALYVLVYEYNIPNIKLKIIGEGSYKQNLIKLAEQLNVNHYIIWKSFIPSRKDLLKEIQTSDIFLLLSKNENYGITVAEALALGTPVIVTKHSALKEFLNEPGCFGVDYPPDPRKVAELILKIANSNIKVGPFSKKIRTWDKVVEDYERIYTWLLSGGGESG